MDQHQRDKLTALFSQALDVLCEDQAEMDKWIAQYLAHAQNIADWTPTGFALFIETQLPIWKIDDVWKRIDPETAARDDVGEWFG